MKSTSVSATLDQLVVETAWLRRLAASLIKDQAAAEDLVHDTVMVAAEQPPRDGRPLRPWLVRVLLNRVRMYGRGEARRSRREQAVAALAVAPPTPDAIVDRIELQRMLAGFVLELSKPLREVVLLHYFEGLSSGAIGNRLGIASSTVRWRLKQAIDELRDRLEHRSPNRAWVATLAGFAGVPRGGATASSATLVVGGVAAVLGLVAVVVLAWRALPRPEPIEPRAQRGESIPTIVARSVASSEGGRAAVPPGLDGVAPDPDRQRFTGVVVDGHGRPVHDAEIRTRCGYMDELDDEPTTMRSAPDGTFALEVEAECRLSVWAVKGDTSSAREHTLPLRLGIGQLAPFRLALLPMQLGLFKVVDAQTGAPIAGARLSTDNFRGKGTSAVTDATGLARLAIEDHAEVQKLIARGMASSLRFRTISVDAPGYPSVAEKLLDASGRLPDERSARTVQLVRGIRVSGRVVGPDGRGVARSYVVIEDDADIEARMTDADGAFDVAVPRPGRYRAHARPPGRTLARVAPVEIEIGPDGRTDVMLALGQADRRGMVTGIVVDGAGTPVVGAWVRVPEDRLRPVVTDRDGRFSFRVGALALLRRPGEASRQLFLVASHGALASPFTPVELRDRDQNHEVTLAIGPSGIAGVVVDLDGVPVPGADVWLNFCCGKHRLIEGTRVEADAQGRFAFDVPRGEFVLSVRRSLDDDFDDRDDRVVSGGARDVRLVIP